MYLRSITLSNLYFYRYVFLHSHNPQHRTDINNDSVHVCFKYFSLVWQVDIQQSIEINSHEKLLLLTQFICMKVFLVVYFLWYFSLPFITLILLSTSTHPMGMIFYKIYVSGQCFTKYNVFYYTVAHNIVQVETGAELDEIGKSEGCSEVNALYLECKCHVGLYRSITSVPTAIHVLSGG